MDTFVIGLDSEEHTGSEWGTAFKSNKVLKHATQKATPSDELSVL